MSLSEPKSIRISLIPWIMAIVALIGLNALASVHRFTKKDESSHESAISELSDETQARGGIIEPLVLAEPTPKETVPSCGSPVRVPFIGHNGNPLVPISRAGAVQGRAPPQSETI